MGTSLTGLTPKNTYDGLIKTTDNDSLSGTAKYLSDGLGNDSVLALSTSAMGIGTASPLSVLHIEKASQDNILSVIGQSGFEGALFLSGSGSGKDANIVVGNSRNLEFHTSASATPVVSGTQAMTLTSAGNVGIGTSTPPQKLSVLDSFQDYTSSKFNVSIDSSNTPQSAGRGGSIGLSGETGAGSTSFGAIFGAKENSVFAETGGYLGFMSRANGGPITEKARITSNGYLRMASGTGGIQFNGDTAAANALDDYEEGTWTPVFRGATTAGTYTYSLGASGGGYRKIGSQVTVWASLVDIVESSAGTGDWEIAGLPFAVANVTTFSRGNGNLYVRQSAAARSSLAVLFSNGGTTLFPVYNNGSATASNYTIAADYVANMDIGFVVTYFV